LVLKKVSDRFFLNIAGGKMADFLSDLSGGLSTVLNPIAMGGMAVNALGQGLGGILGTNNNYQATNPVTGAQLDQSINQGFDAVAAQNQLAQQLNNPQLMQQQNQLADALRAQAAGQGPNPAQAALAQSTGNNIAQQASLMAGQRGAGANAGLIARQAGQQGAGIQQQAVGQGATLQAQQQLAAQNQLQQQQAQQANQALQAQGQATNAALGQQGNLLNFQAGANNANAGVASGNAQRNGNLIGGVIGGVASALPFLSQGGEVPDHLSHAASCYYGGGQVDAMVSPGEGYIKPNDAKKVADGKKPIESAAKKIPGKAEVKGDSQKNDTVHAKLDAGGIVIPRSIMEKGEKESLAFLKDALRKGDRDSSDFHSALKRAISSRGK